MTAEAVFLNWHLKIYYYYLKERVGEEGGAEGEGEPDSQMSREFNSGIHLRTPGSWREPKADA